MMPLPWDYGGGGEGGGKGVHKVGYIRVGIP